LDPDLRVKVGDSDVVQDVFVVAHQRFGQFQGHSEVELRAWLARILINHCRDLRDAFVNAERRSVRREIPLRGPNSSGEFATALAPSDESPRRMAIACEDSARIIAGLSLLPTDWQQVVWLRNWERRTFEEIGQQLGRSADAVRKTFLRAIEKLGTLLKDVDASESKSER
jgi:RNA polymerase sigma-70 factor (ECF subfamily)